jgi:hypothetical protein
MTLESMSPPPFQGEGAVGVWRVLLEGRVLNVRD